MENRQNILMYERVCVRIKRERGNSSSFIGLAQIILFKRFAESSLIRYHIQQIMKRRERESERVRTTEQWSEITKSDTINMLTHTAVGYSNCQQA